MNSDNSGTLPCVTEVEVESSSSSSEMESVSAVREAYGEAFNFPSSKTDHVENNTVKCKCCGKRKTSKRQSSNSVEIGTFSFTPMSRNSGSLAQKYLSSENNFQFGINFDSETHKMTVGMFPADIDGDDILIDFGGDDVVKYKGTEGVWRLLTQDQSYFNQDNYYTDNDWVIYMEIIMRTNEKLIKEIEMENPERLSEEIIVDKFNASGWGWGLGGYIPDLGIDKVGKWGYSKIPKVKVPKVSVPKLDLGFYWPEFKLGVPNLGLSMDLIPTIPGLKYLKFWKWFQAPEAVYVKELDDYLRRFINLQSLANAGQATLEYKVERVKVAIAILERIVALVGKPGGWAKFIMWSLINWKLLQVSGFTHYILNDLNRELHIPGTNFCGPGTKTYDRLAQGQTGNHPIDAACVEHDLFYGLHPNGDEIMRSDIELGLFALKRLLSLDASLTERFAGMIVIPGMSTKVFVEFSVNFMNQYLGVEQKKKLE